MTAKVLLYQPRCPFYAMPLGLLAVASALDRRRVAPVIVDGRLAEDPVAALEPHLGEAVCLGVSVLTGAPIDDALRVSRAVKKLRPDLPVVWGGWHPSLLPREVLDEAECVDLVVIGQGEPAFRELVDALLDGRWPSEVAGIALRDGCKSRLTPARPLAPYEQLPPADYSLLPVEHYFELKGHRQLDYVTSVGCRYRCRFCADPAVFKRQRSAIPLDRVATELTTLAHRYGVEDVSFQDETFFSSRRWTLDLATSLVDCGALFTWTATMRADQGARLTDDDFRLLARSRLRKLLIGVESGSSAMLEHLHKDVTIEQIETVTARCHDHGIAATYPFIFAIPGETSSDVAASVRLARRLKAMSWRNTTPFFFFKPYPGSELACDAASASEEPSRTLDEWSRFDYVTTSSPWMDESTAKRLQLTDYYSHLGWGRTRWWSAPIQALARWRCRHDRFAWPVEKLLIEWFRPPPPLA